jgi:hypothetical protein
VRGERRVERRGAAVHGGLHRSHRRGGGRSTLDALFVLLLPHLVSLQVFVLASNLTQMLLTLWLCPSSRIELARLAALASGSGTAEERLVAKAVGLCRLNQVDP